MNTKDIIYIVIILLLLGIAGFALTKLASDDTVMNPDLEMDNDRMPVEADGGIGDGAEPLTEEARGNETVLGMSVDNNPITGYHFGTGETELLLIGGVHGGYSWNTSLLAYELIDYLDSHPKAVPESIMVTIIPTLNPDGLKKTVGTYGRFASADALLLGESERIAGRFNENKVDLNRNFDCNWKSEGVWRSQKVSGGAGTFSEPEAAALRDYVEKYTPAAAVVWFSAEGKVYPSACNSNPTSESKILASTFAAAANYPAEPKFDSYAITGDMVNWLASENIPAISVLLTNHKDSEFNKNWEGVEAILKMYAE